jgi:hypothetical protein
MDGGARRRICVISELEMGLFNKEWRNYLSMKGVQETLGSCLAWPPPPPSTLQKHSLLWAMRSKSGSQIIVKEVAILFFQCWSYVKCAFSHMELAYMQWWLWQVAHDSYFRWSFWFPKLLNLYMWISLFIFYMHFLYVSIPSN